HAGQTVVDLAHCDARTGLRGLRPHLRHLRANNPVVIDEHAGHRHFDLLRLSANLSPARQNDLALLKDCGNFAGLETGHAASVVTVGSGKGGSRYRPPMAVAILASNTTLMQDAGNEEATEQAALPSAEHSTSESVLEQVIKR